MSDFSEKLRFPKSYWLDSCDLPSFPSIKDSSSKHYDLLVVGAGITGITTAWLLAKEGLKVALIEGRTVLSGTTGHTTAKVTAQHGLIYAELIKNFDLNTARQYYQANQQAIIQIKQIISELNINCDWESKDASVYAVTEAEADQLKAEYEAYKQLRIPGELSTDKSLTGIDYKLILKMRDQAQFHPLKYLSAVLKDFTEKGGLVFEESRAADIKIEEDETKVIFTNGEELRAKFVVQASQYPFYDGLKLYPTRLIAERSYVIAAKTKIKPPQGLFINVDDSSRSLRTVNIRGEEAMLFVGENHKTGQGKQTNTYYDKILKFAEQTYQVDDLLYHWSTQDLRTIDKLPYVGKMSTDKENIFVATGFRKWGMTNGTAAAFLIKDLILKKENQYEEIVTPERFLAMENVKEFVTTNSNVAKELISGKIEAAEKTVDQLSKDDGAIVTINNEKYGAYRDSTGELFLVDSTCTHLGCEVSWNEAEKSWDCPCHGSRYTVTGEIINGPAEKPLQKFED